MENIESKRKRSEMKTGGHLAIISDFTFLRDAKKDIILKDGFPTVIVTFQDGKGRTHDQAYLIDGGDRQRYFNNMLKAAGIDITEGTPKKKDCIGQRLWIFIKEVHYVNDDTVVMHGDEPYIDYHIFRVYPHIEGGKKPKVGGDPENHDGIPGGDFVEYKNVSDSFTREEKPVEKSLKKEEPTKVTPEKQDAFKCLFLLANINDGKAARLLCSAVW